MLKQFLPAFRITLLFTVLTGLVYPGVVTALSQVLFPDQANGSLISRSGRLIGSSWIAQNFVRPEYFRPRPSSAGSDGFDASSSSGSNLGPTSQKLVDRVKASEKQFRLENPGFPGAIPSDAVTAGGSGLDPHISPATALAQVGRVATARRVDSSQVQQLVERIAEGRTWGFVGESRVNVLLLNLALDDQFPAAK